MPDIYILAVMLLAGCEKIQQPAGCGCFNVDLGVGFTVSDSAGNDMLNPANPDAFKRDDITLFHVIYVNGKEQLPMYKNFDIAAHDGLYRLWLAPNDDQSIEYPITLIEWRNHGTDTLMCEITRTRNSWVTSKVWLNGELKWQSYPEERVIPLVK